MAKRNRKNRAIPQKQINIPPTTQLDIIILVHGRFDLLAKCLASIPDAVRDISYRVVLVDNASPDTEEANLFYETIDKSKCVVIRNKQNIGFPAGCNQGFKRGRSPHIFMLNSDVILSPDSVVRMMEDFSDPKIGVVGMKLIFPEDTEGLKKEIRPAGKIQHAGLMTNIKGDFVHAFIGWSPDHPKVNAVRDMYAVTGAALLTKRDIYTKAGGLYEGYGLGCWEDVDFCLTVRDMGYNIIVETKAEGIHYTGATSEKYGLPYAMDSNRFLFMQRWMNRVNYTEWIVL